MCIKNQAHFTSDFPSLTTRADISLATRAPKTSQTTHITELEGSPPNNMALPIEDGSETAADVVRCVPPLDSDDYTADEKSSPCSSPPPVNKGVSFKPFAMSRAQKRAIAGKSSREKLATVARSTSESEGRQTGGAGVRENAAKEARNDRISDATDLKSLIDAAKQKALANNKPKKAERVAELYQRSLNDERLTVLLETALRTNATPEQQQELQRYVDGTKTTTTISRDTMPKDITTTQMSTTESDTEVQASIVPMEATTTTASQPAEPITPDLIATFCATQLWPRYCRLPPGPNTSVDFKAFTSSTINDRDQSVPRYPAPRVWLDEVTTELSFLLDMARVDRGAWIQTLMARPGYGGQDVHALLAEEVSWATHNALYKKGEVRREIGVLLECVGIESKGAFWYSTKTR